MKTGDAIFWKGTTGLAKKIAQKYGGYSHVSLVVDMYLPEDTIFLVEALPHGLELRNLEVRLREYDIYEMGVQDRGMAWHYDIDCPPEARTKMREFAIRELALGVKYDYPTLLKMLWTRARVSDERYICGEFVWRAWEEGGFVKPQKYVPLADEMINYTRGKLICLT